VCQTLRALWGAHKIWESAINTKRSAWSILEEIEMKFAKRIAIALFVVSLVTGAGTAAFGKTRSGDIEFEKTVKVGGTAVKSGSYKAIYDEQTMELTIVKKGKVVVKTAARLERRDNKARGTRVSRRGTGDELELISIAFDGSDKDVVVGQAGMQAGGNN
jgi:hypothetical protein